MQLTRSHRLLALFLALYAVAQTILLIKGNGTRSLLDASILLVLCLLARWFTRDDASQEPRTPTGCLITLQMLLIGLIIVASMLDGGYIMHITPAWARIPLWANLHDMILTHTLPHMGPNYANGVANFAMYCVPISLVLLMLGIPLSQQGLGRFRRGSLFTAVAWLLPLVGPLLVFVLTGSVAPGRILRYGLANLLQNGVSEEFFSRGVVFGRLRSLMPVEYALYLQALLFGLGHFLVDYHGHGGDVLGTCAEVIVNQTTFGLALGYLMLRTGNIFIGSVVHALYDTSMDFGG